MQTSGSQYIGNGDVSNHAGNDFCADDVISDDDDVMEEEQPQLRGGVFSKFRSVCQNVFQSLIGSKQQRAPEKPAENTTRIIRRRSRQTLVAGGISKKPSDSGLSRVDSLMLTAAPPSIPSNSALLGPVMNGVGSSRPLSHMPAQSSNTSEIGARLAVPIKRGHCEAPSVTAAPTPFRGDVANHTFSAPWSALKQRRLDDSSVRPIEVGLTHAPTTVRGAPVIETTTLQTTSRESDRYSSMTLPHRPVSREFGSALSGETSSLTTPLGAKRRVSLFETKTMTPHFNADKMEAVPYSLDRFPARSSPIVGISSPRPQSPLAPRVVRLDVTSKPSPHSPLVRAPLLSVPTAVNPTAQRLARAYQQLTSTTANRPHMAPVDPSRVHLIDPAQFFSRPKQEVTSDVQPKVEPVSVRSFEPQVNVVQQKPSFRFTTPAAIADTKVLTNGSSSLTGKFSLATPSILVDANSGAANSIWTCSDCDIANSVSNDYCFSCGRSKASSSSEFKPTLVANDQGSDIAIKRQRQSLPAQGFESQQQQKNSQLLRGPEIGAAQNIPLAVDTTRILAGPSATSTPFIMSTTGPSANNMKNKMDEPSPSPSSFGNTSTSNNKVAPPAAAAPAQPSGGVVGQWRCSNCLFMNDFKAISCSRCSRSSSSATTAVNGIGGVSTGSGAGDNNSSTTTSTPAVGASSRLKRRATLDGGWVCGCQHMNPRSAIVCDLCNAPKPSATMPPPAAVAKPVELPSISKSEPLKLPSLPAMPSADAGAATRLSTATATTTSLTAPIPTPAPIFGAGSGFSSGSVDQSPQKKVTFGSTSTSSSSTATAPTSLTTTNATPLSSTGFGSQFSAKPGQWTCDVCMIRNDTDKVKCAACESPNPNAPATASKPAAEAPKFGILAAPSTTTTSAAPPNGGFSFGGFSASGSTAADAKQPTVPSISFGVSGSTPASSAAPLMGGFKFGGSPSSSSTGAPPNVALPSVNSSAPAAPFTFGMAAAAPASSTPSTTSASAAAAPAPSSFSFGSLAKPAATASSTAPATSAAPAGGFAFTFGAAASTPAASTTPSTAPVFGASTATSTAASTAAATTTSSVFGMASPPPASSASSMAESPAFGSFGSFSKPSTTSSAAPASGGLFGSSSTGSSSTTSGSLFGSSSSSTVPTSSTAAPGGFSFGSAPAASTATATPSGFIFGSSAPSAPAATSTTGGFSFGQPATTSAPTTTFAFGSSAPTSSAAAAPAPAFSFGSTAAPSTAGSSSAPFSFGGASSQPSSTPAPAAAQTNGPTSLFGFGSSAPATGGAAAATTAFGQPPAAAPSSQPAFAFGSLSQSASSATGSSAPAAGSTPAFNFATSVPAFGSSAPTFGSTNGPAQNAASTGTNGSSSVGGFKFDTAAPAFNFSAGNPAGGAAAPAANANQSPSFVFSASGGFSPAPPAGGADGPMLFSSGASVGNNRPKAAAVRKLKVAGRK